MARRRRRELFPAPLRQFVEAEWPPVDGECLGHYSGCGAWCRYAWYRAESSEATPCGAACYAMLAAEYPDRPGVLAAALAADAYSRFGQARLNWLGEDHDAYVDEMIAGWQAYEAIRFAPFRSAAERETRAWLSSH